MTHREHDIADKMQEFIAKFNNPQVSYELVLELALFDACKEIMLYRETLENTESPDDTGDPRRRYTAHPSFSTQDRSGGLRAVSEGEGPADSESPHTGDPVDRTPVQDAPHGHVKCPNCDAYMETETFQHEESIAFDRIDTCPDCGYKEKR